MSWKLLGKGIGWAIGLATVATTVTAVKTKTGGPTYDPDQPRAKDGAPRPDADRDWQDARFPCEFWSPGACTETDVADWVWSYYKYGILPMQEVSADLHRDDPDNAEANLLVARGQSISEMFWQSHPGWYLPENEKDPSAPVEVADGNEMSEIQRINEDIDVVIALRKEMAALYMKLNPGKVPHGASKADIDDAKKEAEVGAGTYAAAGAVVGLGIALAFVVATNKSKQRPGG